MLIFLFSILEVKDYGIHSHKAKFAAVVDVFFFCLYFTFFSTICISQLFFKKRCRVKTAITTAITALKYWEWFTKGVEAPWLFTLQRKHKKIRWTWVNFANPTMCKRDWKAGILLPYKWVFKLTLNSGLSKIYSYIVILVEKRHVSI